MNAAAASPSSLVPLAASGACKSSRELGSSASLVGCTGVSAGFNPVEEHAESVLQAKWTACGVERRFFDPTAKPFCVVIVAILDKGEGPLLKRSASQIDLEKPSRVVQGPDLYTRIVFPAPVTVRRVPS
jgi:hypothetical protein